MLLAYGSNRQWYLIKFICEYLVHDQYILITDHYDILFSIIYNYTRVDWHSYQIIFLNLELDILSDTTYKNVHTTKSILNQFVGIKHI